MRCIKLKDKALLKGIFEEAQYKDQELSEYENNPYIEALPPIWDDDDIMGRFMVSPKITETEKSKESNIRYHVLKRIKNFIQPLPIHFELERRLSALIRRGYLARNPLDKTFLEKIRKIHELREDQEKSFKEIDEHLDFIRSTADSLSIIGISGIGKTTAIERLLLMYPQVIKHDIYKENYFNRTQIVWLKIDCPYDGSLSTLCKSFFKAIDDILGTRYLEKYGYLNRVTSTMLLHMTSLAVMYGIGVLVIDEIQHLLHAKNDQEDMLNFFVTLSNTVGIPMVLIGTSKAQALFKGNFRQARRAASDGSIIWDRMSKDSEEWDFFIESLWLLQCLKTNTELTEELKETFYTECLGITSVAVNLFILVQERILFDEDNTSEIITSSIIKKTAKEDMKIIQPMLNAIRKNDISAMWKYEDIMIDLDEVMLQQKYTAEYYGKIKKSFEERKKSNDFKRQDITEELALEIAALGIAGNLIPKDINEIVSKVISSYPVNTDISVLKMESIEKVIELNKKKEKIDIQKNNELKNILPLLEARKEALEKKIHPYELLKKNGYIADTQMFI